MSKLETNTVDSISGTSTLTLGGSNASVVSAGTEVRSNKLSPASGTALQIGDSGDTITIPSGATIVNSGTQTGFGGLSNASYWQCTGDQTISAATATVITGSWVTATSNLQGGNELGTDLSQSSGVFTFPSTGIWHINCWVRLLRDGDSRYNNLALQSTSNNSSFTNESLGSGFIKDQTTADDATAGINVFAILDITDVSNQKIRLQLTPENQVVVNGNSSSSFTGLIALKLGNT